jgi:cytochrome c
MSGKFSIYKTILILIAVVIFGTGFKLITTGPSQQPQENRFKRVVLVEHLFNPMQLEIAPDGDIYMIESNGRLTKVNPQTKEVTLLGVIKNYDQSEHGLIGLALDPNFEQTHWVYVQYFLPTKEVAQIARFTINGNTLDLTSEKRYVQIPYENNCCHAGGSMTFDSKGNLYFSTGDNSDAFQGLYAPVDERPGHSSFNSLRTAGSPMDLRGKICRIHPENDGTYTIPKGNLFEGRKDARPEIYVMGCRNPFRIFVDKATDVLYWGEVGPDAPKDSTRGPRGYDEFNIATKAGNYGWPMIIGNNIPYAKIDPATNEPAGKFDPEHPVNDSYLNPGLKDLPPAQPATIWYPYAKSDIFPELGEGGRAAIGGPVYHYDPHIKSAIQFPKYYDKKWFIADWMRNWIKSVSLDDDHKLQKIEDFMPSTYFYKPVSMAFSPKDGALYMLEFGDAWGPNSEARLVRIEYTKGNRPPVAGFEADKSSGRAPLLVHFSGKKSYDPDQDVLKYAWAVDGRALKGKSEDIKYTFGTNGIHKVTLRVTDPSGAVSTQTQLIKVGNSMPVVAFDLDNHTFYPDNLNYKVTVNDAEDGRLGKGISPRAVKVSLAYEPKFGVMSTTAAGKVFNHGEVLMNESDCKGCHKINGVSVGPSFTDVANRYLPEAEKDDKVIDKLANKIISGGSGVWFKDRAMSAHPQLSTAQTTEIVQYILSLAVKKEPAKAIPVSGNIALSDKDHPKIGFYTLTASYTDRGGNTIKPLTATAVEVLRYPKFFIGDFDELHGQNISGNVLLGSADTYSVLKNIDLTNIKKITFKVNAIGGSYEIHIDTLNGPQIGLVPLTYTGTIANSPGSNYKLQEVTNDLTPVKGKHNIYIVYRNKIAPGFYSAQLEWVSFER